MDYLHIEQSPILKGQVDISGAKNAALPLLALSLLSKKSIKFYNAPNVTDISTFCKLLEYLGAQINRNEVFIEITTSNIIHTKALYDIVRKIRASILVLGPLLTRFKKCQVSLPGGCVIGVRPVDLHLKAMKKMGADINIVDGYIHAKAANGLKGADIFFDKISVTGSENVIMAAALAKGKTRIINVAKEPEVVQLCEVLKEAGVEISGIASDEIIINGTDGELISFKDIHIIPDRIEAGTYLCAGAITNSSITLNHVNLVHIAAITRKLEEIGFSFRHRGTDSITLLPAKVRKSFNITTAEYPGFPTDVQSQFMALATQCEGVSKIEERLFENRFMHVAELQRLGADISLQGNIANVSGARELIGANVMATDLRASSALILAGLVAKNSTEVHRIYHLDRGYENLEEKFLKLGAKIIRKKSKI